MNAQLFWAAELPAIVSTVSIASMGVLIGSTLGRGHCAGEGIRARVD